MSSYETQSARAEEPSFSEIRVLETDDFDHMAEAFHRWNHRFEQLSRGRFHGTLRFADYGDVQIFDCEVNQIIRCRGSRAPDSFTFSPIEAENAGSYWKGRQLRIGQINVAGPAQETDHRTCFDYRHAAISVHRELLERVSRGLIGVDHEALLGSQALEINGLHAVAMVSRWRDALGFQTSQRSGCTLNGTDGVPPLELVAGLVRALASGRIADPIRLTPQSRRQIVREAEEFAHSQPPDRVTLLGLCELTRVSERSLHYAFVEVTGMSPKAFLKALRLNQARRAIRESDRRRGCITAIARRLGFLRPGEFAADYRRQFGELPSRF